MEKKRIIYIDTLYSLFLVLILFPNIEENIYYSEEENLMKLEKNLKKIVHLKRFKNINFKLKRYIAIRFFLKKIKKDIKNIGIKEFYLKDKSEYGKFFLNNFSGRFYLLEDGTINYNLKELEKEKIKKLKLLKRIRRRYTYLIKKDYPSLGLSEKINTIYLTGILPIPDLIKDKVKIIDIEEKWNNLPIKKKNEILDVFNIKLENLEKLKKEQDKILLITQPLSEDGIILENEKIKIYSDILKERNIKKIYIKPHPREKTNYKEVLNEFDIVILEKEFPIELFMLLDMKFEKVITLFSTAALNFRYKYQIEFIGTKKYPKLYEKFGDIEI